MQHKFIICMSRLNNRWIFDIYLCISICGGTCLLCSLTIRFIALDSWFITLSQCVSLSSFTADRKPIWAIKVNTLFFLLSCPNNSLNVNHVGPHLIAHTQTVIICPHVSCVHCSTLWILKAQISQRVYFHNTSQPCGQNPLDLGVEEAPSPVISTDKACSRPRPLFFLSCIINQHSASKHVP